MVSRIGQSLLIGGAMVCALLLAQAQAATTDAGTKVTQVTGLSG